MNTFKLIAFAVGSMGCVSAALAEPAQMTDEQMTAVTAGGGFTLVIRNTAIASNNVSTDGGSASVRCLANCLAVNIPVGSSNISGIITQTATATASSH